MKKLKNKVFYVIFSILTLFLISILVIFNSQNYQQEVSSVRQNLMRMDENKNKETNKLPDVEQEQPNEVTENTRTDPRIFIDSTIYTAILDNNFKVLDVINHTTNDVSDEEIKKIAEEIINEDRKNI